jgi:hypothetical protein
VIRKKFFFKKIKKKKETGDAAVGRSNERITVWFWRGREKERKRVLWRGRCA